MFSNKATLNRTDNSNCFNTPSACCGVVYFREILLGLCEPATNQKLDLTKWKSSFADYQKVADNSLSACQVLRDTVEVALKHRKPKGVLIDEAQHMCVTVSGKRLVNQPDSIKSVANRTETTHDLVRQLRSADSA